MNNRTKMPEPAPTMELKPTITATLLHDFDRFENGSLLMRLSDSEVGVSQGDRQLGRIGVAMGGVLFVQFEKGRLWKLDLMSIFAAAMKADKEWDTEQSKQAA